ncbi:hypothetical protein [Parasitella parasitica]|uniref:RZ-type domain-containing protein n=1 Tax=Parasitella parasitica TaxID=35722 RepID=A0A0B7NR22_9FUNG|nr:hypothetical protein [Parasitella parasitica]
MNGFDEFKEAVLSNSTIHSKTRSLQSAHRVPQPRFQSEKSRRPMPTSMDDLVPQIASRRTSSRQASLNRSPQSIETSPSGINDVSQAPSSSTSNDYTPYASHANGSSKLVPSKSTSFDSNHTQGGHADSITPNASTSTTNSNQHRSRDATVDSLTSIKFKPAVTKFEDLKTEAIDSWGEGVDVALVDSKNKKKTEWLSESAFFSEETVHKSSDDSSVLSTTSDVNIITHHSKTERSYADAVNDRMSTPAWVTMDNNQTQSDSSPGARQSVEDHNMPAWARQTTEDHKTPAWIRQSTDDHKTPAWARESGDAHKMPAWASDSNSSSNKMSYTPQPQQMQQPQPKMWMPGNVVGHHPHHQSMQPMAPVVMMPQGYIPMAANAYHPSATPMTSYSITPVDREWMHCFYSVITKFNIRSVVNSFQKKIDTVLQRSLADLSFRSFGLLLQALTVVMEYEANLSMLETARKIHQYREPFLFYFVRYTKSHATLPDDLKVILQFSVTLSRFYPKIYKDLPIDDILRIYEGAKGITSQDMNAEFLKQLHLLKANSVEGGVGTGDYLDHSLPSLPVADKVVTEVIQKLKPLQDYESKKEVSVTNKLHNPWPNLDIAGYTLCHFLMLRDELVGPVQRIIRELFKGHNSGSIAVPECSVYEKTMPVASTLSFQTSDPCIVFKLGPALATDLVVSDFQEGGLVFILPENRTAVSPSDLHAAKKQVAEVSMMGQAVRASSSYTTSSQQQLRLVSIHIDREDIHKLDWSLRYTIVTSNINALATKAVLKWLHAEHLKFESKHWSSVLTPRVLAAKNMLTQAQLTAWDDENQGQASTAAAAAAATATNNDATPDYLVNADIDIACIMSRAGNFRAKPGSNIWPSPPSSSHLDQAPGFASRRFPAYSLSPSQVKAVKFALTHRIAVISGPPGTGKTFLASKLAQLMNEALTAGLFHQPILILAKTQSSLDDILKNVVVQIPDMVRFGSEPYDEVLKSKQATRLAAPSVSDSNYRQFQQLERQLTWHQAKLHTLLQERAKITAHCPSTLSSAIPPAYLAAFNKGYSLDHPQSSATAATSSTASDSHHRDPLLLWNAWACNDKLTKHYVQAKLSQAEIGHAQWTLENSYLKRGGRGIMPMNDINTIRNRFTYIASNAPQALCLSTATKWPFESSATSGEQLRASILQVWRHVPANQVWGLADKDKTQLINSLVKMLVSAIDSDIEDVLQQQLKTAQAYDEILTQKWTYLCRFNRVIGMTADFAAANRAWVSTLWPRSVIVDEASEILESTIASTILGPRTEHLVLLGTSDNLFKPRITNPELAGNPRNFDVSLFERWKGSNSDMTLLEEQWRMHSDVASIVDKFHSSKKSPESSTLITAPMISYSDNMVDGKNPNLEALYGITQRVFYVDYQPSDDTAVDNCYSKLLHTQVSHAEVDEARYVASLAVYMSQQQHTTVGIAILTVSIVQKYLIRHILRQEIPKRTCFTKNMAKIHLDTVEQYTGRQNNFAIVSTATPGHSPSAYDNVTRALTRARYGLYIIGKPGKDRVHSRWSDFANFMKENGQFGPAIQLTCHTHGHSLFAGQWQDFLKMKNGGCQQPCATLMSDGHVCKEECHFGGHDQIICQEPCNRPRPSNCTHACERKCFECSKSGFCPPCRVETAVELSCGHSYRGICHKLQNLDLVECQQEVLFTFPCKHETMVKCCQLKDMDRMVCQVQAEVKLPCGHTAMSQCGVETICTHLCDGTLECGHTCPYLCGEEHSHQRSECVASCSKQLICGHRCAKGCRNPDDHTERCTENHTCSGLCGEPCPPCVKCNGDLQCAITLRSLSEFDKDEKVYMLPECGCVFSSEGLDSYFQTQAKNGEHTAVKVWGCPSCQKTIYTALRYNQYIKTEINLVNKIKMRLEKERQQLTPHEREQIISAMNDETRLHAIHNMVGGRWFVCQNQHPYYVGDCGGATEVSKCPECDAPIGGTQHKVVESNRFYGEFDGSVQPAWPGQPGTDN